jgi:hypothetical protein
MKTSSVRKVAVEPRQRDSLHQPGEVVDETAGLGGDSGVDGERQGGDRGARDPETRRGAPALAPRPQHEERPERREDVGKDHHVDPENPVQHGAGEQRERHGAVADRGVDERDGERERRERRVLTHQGVHEAHRRRGRYRGERGGEERLARRELEHVAAEEVDGERQAEDERDQGGGERRRSSRAGHLLQHEREGDGAEARLELLREEQLIEERGPRALGKRSPERQLPVGQGLLEREALQEIRVDRAEIEVRTQVHDRHEHQSHHEDHQSGDRPDGRAQVRQARAMPHACEHAPRQQGAKRPEVGAHLRDSGPRRDPDRREAEEDVARSRRGERGACAHRRRKALQRGAQPQGEHQRECERDLQQGLRRGHGP